MRPPAAPAYHAQQRTCCTLNSAGGALISAYRYHVTMHNSTHAEYDSISRYWSQRQQPKPRPRGARADARRHVRERASACVRVRLCRGKDR